MARRFPTIRPYAFALAILALCALIVPARAAAAPSRVLILEDANLVDGRSDAVLPHRTVVVRDGLVESVLEAPPANVPDSAFVLVLTGSWLMPGLVDSHVHISHDSRRATEAALARALRGGVTAVRDMGGDARRLAGLARDAMLGEIDSPDIVYSAVFAGPTFFTDPRVVDVSRGLVPGEAAWARAVRPTTDLTSAVLEARGAGCRAVKIYTDLPPAELARVSNAAHAAGLKVWSHATVFPSRPSDAVAAGIDVLSHAAMLQWQTTKDVPPRYGPHRDTLPLGPEAAEAPALKTLFAEMVRRHTILDATLFVFRESAGDATSPPKRRAFDHAADLYGVAATRAAHEAGVAISAGTDDMIGEDAALPNLHAEMRMLVEAGLTPMQALQAATRVSAEACGAADRFGTIEPGKRANLLVLGADPTKDIGNTTKIRFVIKAGKLLVGE